MRARIAVEVSGVAAAESAVEFTATPEAVRFTATVITVTTDEPNGGFVVGPLPPHVFVRDSAQS
jgi:hypothetical protein